MTRQEHLEWSKKRALSYLETGDLSNTFASFMSDMGKHEETANHIALPMGTMLLMNGNLSTEKEMKDWIMGFN